MSLPNAFQNSEAKTQIDTLVTEFEKVCQEISYARAYAAAKLLRISLAAKDFSPAISDFQEQLVKQRYFSPEDSGKPIITKEQIEQIWENNDTLKKHELIEEKDEFYLAHAETDQKVFQIHCHPRYTDKAQFWGWQLHFQHFSNPRLDVRLDYN